jgi:ABC-type lipoprotein release transport system permease subunit
MPEQYVARLEQSRIVTVKHITPRLRQKVKWPETKWVVILVGISDRAYNPAVHAHELVIGPVTSGKIVLGNEVHQGLGLDVGDKIRFMGRKFVVYKCREELGTEEDMTVWVNLREAQKLVDKKGLISEILAFECRSAWTNLPIVRAEITNILPDTQIVEKSSDVLAKIHAYVKVEEEGKAAIERERESIAHLRTTWMHFALVLGPLVMVISVVWIALLAAANVRRRQMEIGILRTLGFRSLQILYIFLSRAVFMGFLGGFGGFLVGRFLANIYLEPGSENSYQWKFAFCMFGLAVLVAVAVTVTASWIPAMRAANVDPSVTLQEE